MKNGPRSHVYLYTQINVRRIRAHFPSSRRNVVPLGLKGRRVSKGVPGIRRSSVSHDVFHKTATSQHKHLQHLGLSQSHSWSETDSPSEAPWSINRDEHQVDNTVYAESWNARGPKLVPTHGTPNSICPIAQRKRRTEHVKFARTTSTTICVKAARAYVFEICEC